MAPVMACPHCRRPFPRCVVCQQFESTPNTEEHSCGEMSTIFVTCPVSWNFWGLYDYIV